jgi:hypothetical protein
MAATVVEKSKRRRGPISEAHRAALREAALRRWATEPTANTTTGTMPPVLLRLHLTRARRAGAEFEAAWPTAVASATQGLGRARAGWVEALEGTRPSWAAAYRRDEGQACWSALERARI